MTKRLIGLLVLLFIVKPAAGYTQTLYDVIVNATDTVWFTDVVEYYNEMQGTTYDSQVPDGLEPQEFCDWFNSSFTISVEHDCAQWINTFRDINGEDGLIYSSALSYSAFLHNKEMIDVDYVSHDTSYGDSSLDRIEYVYENLYGIYNVWSGGENVHRYPSKKQMSHDYFNLLQFCAFYHSIGHRQNMLKSKWEYIGIDFWVIYNEDNEYYYYYSTQNFCARY
jgi:uncharacterized protein YkwD